MARRHMNKNLMAMSNMENRHWVMHKKMKGVEMLVLGALVLANAYWGFLGWPWFIGGAFVLGGILKLFAMGCRQCRM